MHKILKDVRDILIMVVVLYFFVLGVLFFFNSKIECIFTQEALLNMTSYDYTISVDMVSLRAFVNTSGLFGNNYVFSKGQRVDNCTLKIV